MGTDEMHPLVKHRLQKPRTIFAPGQRIKMNIVPVFLNLFVPWAVYVLACGVLSFSMPYKYPGTTTGILFLICLFWLVLTGMALWHRKNDPDPTWWTYVAFMTGLAIFSAATTGMSTYDNLSKPYYQIRDLKVIPTFDPGNERGQNVLDAGIVYFTYGGHIDGGRSWHFKHHSTYCVAPIVGNSSEPATQSYDFWAVGKDCCSLSASDFRCGAWGSQKARSAIRVLDEEVTPYYRLAVQQAETLYNIMATHPVFFYWAADPLEEVNSWNIQAFKDFLFGCAFFFVVSLFCLVLALYKFSWIGRGAPNLPEPHYGL